MASLFEQLGSVKWEDLEGYKTNDSSLFEYSNSKLMVIMMARELNKRLKVSMELGMLRDLKRWMWQLAALPGTPCATCHSLHVHEGLFGSAKEGIDS
jgi:hypothetical protein